MLDIKLIRENPTLVRRNLERRRDPEILKLFDKLLEVDEQWRKLTTRVNELRRRRNEISAEIARLLKEGRDVSKLRMEAKRLPELIKEAEEERRRLWEEERYILMRLPNLLHESVPDGEDELSLIHI